jgi:hypothetical protein
VDTSPSTAYTTHTDTGAHSAAQPRARIASPARPSKCKAGHGSRRNPGPETAIRDVTRLSRSVPFFTYLLAPADLSAQRLERICLVSGDAATATTGGQWLSLHCTLDDAWTAGSERASRDGGSHRDEATHGVARRLVTGRRSPTRASPV